VLSLRDRDFVEAARALGASPARLVTRHLIPNALAPVVVAAAFAIGDNILAESSLSFFGLGCSRRRRRGATCCKTRSRRKLKPRRGWYSCRPRDRRDGTRVQPHRRRHPRRTRHSIGQQGAAETLESNRPFCHAERSA